MIIGVYLQYLPKGSWHLVSATISAEIALKDKEATINEAITAGNKEAKVAIKTFDSIYSLPETLKTLEENTKLLYS